MNHDTPFNDFLITSPEDIPAWTRDLPTTIFTNGKATQGEGMTFFEYVRAVMTDTAPKHRARDLALAGRDVDYRSVKKESVPLWLMASNDASNRASGVGMRTNGLVVIDIDHLPSAQAVELVKKELAASPQVMFCAASLSMRGVVAYVYAPETVITQGESADALERRLTAQGATPEEIRALKDDIKTQGAEHAQICREIQRLFYAYTVRVLMRAGLPLTHKVDILTDGKRGRFESFDASPYVSPELRPCTLTRIEDTMRDAWRRSRVAQLARLHAGADVYAGHGAVLASCIELCAHSHGRVWIDDERGTGNAFPLRSSGVLLAESGAGKGMILDTLTAVLSLETGVTTPDCGSTASMREAIADAAFTSAQNEQKKIVFTPKTLGQSEYVVMIADEADGGKDAASKVSYLADFAAEVRKLSNRRCTLRGTKSTPVPREAFTPLFSSLQISTPDKWKQVTAQDDPATGEGRRQITACIPRTELPASVLTNTMEDSALRALIQCAADADAAGAMRGDVRGIVDLLNEIDNSEIDDDARFNPVTVCNLAEQGNHRTIGTTGVDPMLWIAVRNAVQPYIDSPRFTDVNTLIPNYAGICAYAQGHETLTDSDILAGAQIVLESYRNAGVTRGEAKDDAIKDLEKYFLDERHADGVRKSQAERYVLNTYERRRAFPAFKDMYLTEETRRDGAGKCVKYYRKATPEEIEARTGTPTAPPLAGSSLAGSSLAGAPKSAAEKRGDAEQRRTGRPPFVADTSEASRTQRARERVSKMIDGYRRSGAPQDAHNTTFAIVRACMSVIRDEDTAWEPYLKSAAFEVCASLYHQSTGETVTSTGEFDALWRDGLTGKLNQR